MNANQVFSWRRLYQQGRLERRASETPDLLPVRVIGARSMGARTRRTPSPMIQVELPKGQLRRLRRLCPEFAQK
jgi:transposase-like protein